MIPAKYATPGSGVLADKIGWIDFGPGFTLVAGATPVHIINTLPDLYTVEFDISLINNSGPLTNYVSAATPTYVESAFGNTGYTAIGGQVAIYSDTAAGDTNETIKVENIVVKNSKGVATTTYDWVAADAETTQGYEKLQFTTNGSPWALLQNLDPVTGFPISSPIITGVGTTTVLETGSPNGPIHVSAPVFITDPPTIVTATATITGGSKEGVAFGIVITERKQAITDIIESVALQQTGLSHILNAEGEKIQAALAIPGVTAAQLLSINSSVQNMTDSISRLESILQGKIQVLECGITAN